LLGERDGGDTELFVQAALPRVRCWAHTYMPVGRPRFPHFFE
jgi:hypothetical protein